MEWQDTGAVLTVRRHGETSAILEVFTEAHGRHAGVVRGASSRKMAPNLQPGTQLALTWRARLEDHLGSYSLEPVKSRAAATMGGRRELAALNAITALLSFCLPEREAYPMLYQRTIALLDAIGADEPWPVAYIHWEKSLLEDMGFGLDLSACAVSGATEGLAFVSPRTGRAVAAHAAGEWKSRLLPLPDCLQNFTAAEPAEIGAALRTTGHFLHSRLAPSLGDRPLPPARDRLAELLSRGAGSG